MLPGSSVDKEELEECSITCWRAKVNYMNLGRMQGTGIQVQNQRHKRGNGDSDSISPSRPFLGSAQKAGNTRAACACVYLHTGPAWYLHWLCAHHRSCCDGERVITASCRVICASQQPRFHTGHPLHSCNHSCTQ